MSDVYASEHPDFTKDPENGEWNMKSQSQSSVKLIKNSKGYNWEIKIYADDIKEEMQTLEDIDSKMKEKYGNVLE